MMVISKQLKGSLCLILCSFIWGMAFSAQSSAMRYIQPFTFVFCRCVVSSIVLFAALPLLTKLSGGASNEPPRRAHFKLGALLGVILVITFGSAPSLRPSFEVDGVVTKLTMPETIEILMMSMAAVILLVGKANVKKAVSGNIFAAGMNAMIAIFGIAWMGDTFFNGNLEFFRSHIAEIVTEYPFLFSVALFIMSIMLFSQAATVRTLFPLGIGLGIAPLALVAMFPAVNGYFFFPNYPTEVAAINFDTTGTTRIGKYVLNHSFQLSGFITTFVSIGIGYLIITFFY